MFTMNGEFLYMVKTAWNGPNLLNGYKNTISIVLMLGGWYKYQDYINIINNAIKLKIFNKWSAIYLLLYF